MPPVPTFEEGRDLFLTQAPLTSAHTLSAYRRAIDLFLFFLDDRQQAPQLPIQRHAIPQSRQLRCDALAAEDEALLSDFSRWLSSTPSSPGYPRDYRPYKPATVALRLVGVQRWLSFLDDRGYLGTRFSLANALAHAKQAPTSSTPQVESTDPPRHIDDLGPLLAHYGQQMPPHRVMKSEDAAKRWELTRLRNHALLNALADTGGQVSVVLGMDAALFLNEAEKVEILAQGKNNHTYQTRFTDSLPMIRAYLAKRAIPQAEAEQAPLFISHDPRYEGNRMSRVVAWRVVQRAAKAVGLPEITPHDLRHWRAQQLIQTGANLETVRELLGHRSINTVRAYYGHLIPTLDDPNQKP